MFKQGKVMTWQGKRTSFKRIQGLNKQLVQKTTKVPSSPEILQFNLLIGLMKKVLSHICETST